MPYETAGRGGSEARDVDEGSGAEPEGPEVFEMLHEAMGCSSDAGVAAADEFPGGVSQADGAGLHTVLLVVQLGGGKGGLGAPQPEEVWPHPDVSAADEEDGGCPHGVEEFSTVVDEE